jgi:hypothetical protein
MTERDREQRRLAKGRRLVKALAECDGSAAEVLRIMKGVSYTLFRLLDEKPGTWGYETPEGEWHYKLRRVRNSLVQAPKLFKNLTY